MRKLYIVSKSEYLLLYGMFDTNVINLSIFDEDDISYMTCGRPHTPDLDDGDLVQTWNNTVRRIKERDLT